MSFTILLILLSLILIIPILFILKEKNQHNQQETIQQYQIYSQAQKNIDNQFEQVIDSSPIEKKVIIEFSENHPFVKLLNNKKLPEEFISILFNIGQQYDTTYHIQLTEEQLFTLNKLIEIRIPELLNNYLQLDTTYANSVIIDQKEGATSFDVVLSQLNTILEFSQQLNMQSQSGVVNKLLASRIYLQQIYQNSGLSKNNLSL